MSAVIEGDRGRITYGSVDSDCNVLARLDVRPLSGRTNSDALGKHGRKERDEPGESQEELHSTECLVFRYGSRAKSPTPTRS